MRNLRAYPNCSVALTRAQGTPCGGSLPTSYEYLSSIVVWRSFIASQETRIYGEDDRLGCRIDSRDQTGQMNNGENILVTVRV